MTYYSCPHCGKQFYPADYGEVVGMVAVKSYLAAIDHVAKCPKNPNVPKGKRVEEE